MTTIDVSLPRPLVARAAARSVVVESVAAVAEQPTGCLVHKMLASWRTEPPCGSFSPEAGRFTPAMMVLLEKKLEKLVVEGVIVSVTVLSGVVFYRMALGSRDIFGAQSPEVLSRRSRLEVAVAEIFAPKNTHSEIIRHGFYSV